MAIAASAIHYVNHLRLRPPQKAIFLDPHRHKVVVAGSRFGKTTLALIYLIVAALRFPRSRHWYIAPTRIMAKDIAWSKLKVMLEVVPRTEGGTGDAPMVRQVHEGELQITLVNGSTIKLMTAQEPEHLRGRLVKTVVLDEYGDMDPKVWTAVRPRIGDKELRVMYGELGCSLFIGCVRGDSMVLSRKGMEPIANYSKGSADKVLDSMQADFYGLNHEFHAANGFWNNGTVETRRVRSHFGFELECSLPHPWWVMSPCGIPQWKTTDQLVVGDRVAVDRGMEVWPSIDPCAGFDRHIAVWRDQHVGKRGAQPQPIHIDRMTDDLAYFLGLWLAEGSCEQKIGRVTITCGDQDISESLQRLEAYGIHFEQQSKRKDQWRTNSYELIELFHYLGMPLVRAPKKTMPAWVFSGTRNWAGAFAGGMWDGDGHCDSNRTRVGYNSASMPLIQQLQLLLTNAGIIGRFSSHETKPTKRVKAHSIEHRITLTGENIAPFQAFVQLRIPRKRMALSVMKCDYSRRDGIPYQAELLRTVRNSLRHRDESIKSPRASFSAALDYGSDISYRSLAMFVSTHGNSTSVRELVALRTNLLDHYYWDTVESIENSEARTYDFTIPDTHSFWCNGFISHNTPMKSKTY